MSDHVDGPRSIGDPSADLTDLFAFTSPENRTRTVLAACVFPSAGENAFFSNIIDYSIVVRRVTVAGAAFRPPRRPGCAAGGVPVVRREGAAVGVMSAWLARFRSGLS